MGQLNFEGITDVFFNYYQLKTSLNLNLFKLILFLVPLSHLTKTVLEIQGEKEKKCKIASILNDLMEKIIEIICSLERGIRNIENAVFK